MAKEDVVVEVGAEIASLRAKIVEATEVVRQFKSQAEKATPAAGSGWKSLASEFGLVATRAGLVGAAVGAVSVAVHTAVREAAAFEQALSNVNTVLNLDARGIQQFGRDITHLVRELKLGITSTEALAGAYEVASAGFTDAADAQAVLKAALVAAKAGMTDSKTAVDGLTSILNAYKLSAADATRVSDLMFQAVQDGKTTFPELANSIGEVISTAAQAKVPLEELFAAVAHLTVQGIKTPQAMTSINQAMLQMLAPGEEAKKTLKALGVSAEDLSRTLKTQGLAAALNMVFDATHGDEGQLRKILSDVNAVKAALGLAGENAEGFAEKIQRQADAAGASLKAAAINADNLASSWTDLKAATSELAKELGGLLDGPLRGAVDGVRWYVDEVRKGVEALNHDSAVDPFASFNTSGEEMASGIALLNGEVVNTDQYLRDASKSAQEFFAGTREGLALIGKSQQELVDMGATDRQFTAAINRLNREARLLEGSARAQKIAEAERLEGLRQSVGDEVALAEQAAQEKQGVAKAAQDKEATERSAHLRRVEARNEEFRRKQKAGAYDTSQAELAALDGVLRGYEAAGQGQSENARKLREERGKLARAAADEETDAALRGLESRARVEKLSAAQQVAALQEILGAHEGSVRKREQLEDRLAAEQGKVLDERRTSEREALDDRLRSVDLERAKTAAVRDLTAADEVKFQQKVVSLHQAGTKERMAAEIALYDLKARLRQEEEAAIKRLQALEAELANERTNEIDDEITALQDKMAKEQEAGRSTSSIQERIVALMREKLAIQQQLIDADTKSKVDDEKDPRVKAKLEEVGEKRKADAARDANRDIKRFQEEQRKRAQDLAQANRQVADSYRDAGSAARGAGSAPSGGGAASGSMTPFSFQSTMDVVNAPQAAGAGGSIWGSRGQDAAAAPLDDSEKYETPKQARERRERLAREKGANRQAYDEREKARKDRVAEDEAERQRAWEESWKPPSVFSTVPGSTDPSASDAAGSPDVVAAVQGNSKDVVAAIQALPGALAALLGGGGSRGSTGRQASRGRDLQEANLLAGGGN